MRIIYSSSKDPAWNLAAEEVLFKGKTRVLLLYINKPSVILGCNQVLENELDRTFCRENNIGMFRRISGGGAVYHDTGNINYCFVQDKDAGCSSLSGAFLGPVQQILLSLGLSTKKAARKDLWAGKYKISGTASHVSKNRELHHGTLLYDSDLAFLHAALALTPAQAAEIPLRKEGEGAKVKGIASKPSPVTNIRSLLPAFAALSAQDFLERFIKAATQYYGAELRVFEQKELKEIRDLSKQKYESRSWNELK